jgi:thiamine-monophosphate kinase
LPLTEKSLIAAIRAQARQNLTIALGIADDCSILRVPAGHEILITTDFSLEGMHFRRNWHPAEVVGHRCLARGLSDIAAMGGQPLAAFLSLALPRLTPKKWADGFIKGFFKLADKFRVSLAGGDTAESPSGILADIIVVGSAPKGTAIRRSGAKPGDRIYVTGALGGAAHVLGLLFAGRKLRPNVYPQHFFPTPRIEVGRFLLEKKLASAMIDISDGLSTDLAHICEESDVGAKIEPNAIPRAKAGRERDVVDLSFALHGGDDYELLFTAPPSKRIPAKIADVRFTKIGEVTRSRQIVLVNALGRAHKLKPQGWQHFQK